VSHAWLEQLRQRVAALTDRQRLALVASLQRVNGRGASDRLVAFLELETTAPVGDDDLRAFLSARVPEYMMPSRFVVVDRLPRTAAGKLDRRALVGAHGSELTSQSARGPVAPRTEIENRLVEIWKDVLKVDSIGVTDDFFEIGGDSLLSIRVIARAGREGIRISPERFFERPTIAHVAASINPAGQSTANGRETSTIDPAGEAPLTPIQHWFLDAIPHHRDRWNQSYLLEVGHALDATQWETIARSLVAHHDALRVRLTSRDGRWVQEVPGPNATDCFRVVDLRSTPRGQYASRLAEECEREHAALRLDDGRLFRVVLFDAPAGWQRVFLVGHHALLDSISWSVLLEDLATLVSQSVARHSLVLPQKTAPARAWAAALEKLAASALVATSANHWLEMPIVPDELSTASMAGCNRDADVLTVTLGADDSRSLLQDAPRRVDASTQAMLLSAVLLAWHEWAGNDSLRLDLEGHGRDILGDAIDVSRTVGWFTTVFPLHLALPSRANGSQPNVDAVVAATRTALDALPMRGAAHGLARYLSPDESTRAALAAQPRPSVLFNHLGTHDLTLPSASHLRVVDGPGVPDRDPNAPRAYVLELNSRIEDGRLIVSIEYPRQTMDRGTIERFAHALENAVRLIATGGADTLAGVDAESMAIVANLLAELDEA